MNDRFSINSDNAANIAVLYQSYTVEEVSKIAASFQVGSHQERVVEAIKLIKAVEDIANPYAPWFDQHLRRKEGDGLGDIPDLAKEDILFDLRQQADEIIKLATDAEGRINRKELCIIACKRTGRKSPKTKKQKEDKPLSDDRVGEIFLNEWLPQAAEGHARRELFRQMEREADQEREELESAIAQGLSKKVKKLQEKVAATNARSFQHERKFYPAAEEIDRRREAVTDDERISECEAFRLSLEKGTRTQPRIIHTVDHARAILLGTPPDYAGFLEFVRFPEEKPKYSPTLPQSRGKGGAFVKQEKGVDGKVKSNSDGPNVDESPVHLPQSSEEERTEKKSWKRR